MIVETRGEIEMKLSFKTKFSYGVAAISDNAMYTLAGTYLLLFLTTVAGVSPAVAGTISAIGSVWEAMCAPIVGYKSDRMQSRFGRRKPFLIMAAFPIAVITALLFTTLDFNPAMKTAYYVVMVILFWTCSVHGLGFRSDRRLQRTYRIAFFLLCI